MGYKKVCLNCRVAFNLSQVTNKVITLCPSCGVQYKIYNHKFRPPKKTDAKQWRVVQYLYLQGFNYQHVSDDLPSKEWYASNGYYMRYPKTMKDAVKFVALFKGQSIKQLP
ncbi:hypothetical protein [Mucilaginibacter defluvii]|uniref:Uncharacterized protein n=1 Tax=Mucilaginibacter defluvii TaxID=1196019 RepID=A0ABP9FGG6_9SPHI